MTVVRIAFRDCAAHHHDATPLPAGPIEWLAGTTILAVDAKVTREGEPRLTWETWSDTLTGIRGFVGHFHRVYPALEIYHYDGHAQESEEVRIGEARIRDSL